VAKILVVEDDPKLAKLVSDWLKTEHHIVECINDGEEAAGSLKAYDYDLLVLDWNLPRVSGIELVQGYRARGGQSPVLMLTGMDKIADKEKGFDSGADDYLTKPFEGRELTARVRALLRRPSAIVGNTLEFAGVKIDRGNYCVTRAGEEINLLPKEFALLEFMMLRPNRVFSAEELLNKVWPNDSTSTADALTTCIKRLRKKLEVEGQQSIIRTVHGVGYKLALPGAKE
jgi:DNA-binding response OmpR family regulator